MIPLVKILGTRPKRIPAFFAQSKVEAKVSLTKLNNKGDRGSPCLRAKTSVCPKEITSLTIYVNTNASSYHTGFNLVNLFIKEAFIFKQALAVRRRETKEPSLHVGKKTRKLPSLQRMRSLGWSIIIFFSHVGPTTKITFPNHPFPRANRTISRAAAPSPTSTPPPLQMNPGAAASCPPPPGGANRGGTGPTRSQRGQRPGWARSRRPASSRRHGSRRPASS